MSQIKFDLGKFLEVKEENLSTIVYFDLEKSFNFNLEKELNMGSTIGITKDCIFWLDLTKDIESKSVAIFIETYLNNPLQSYLKLKQFID